MQRIVAHGGAEISPVSPIPLPLPGGAALARLLLGATPAGAAALRCWPYGFERDFGSDRFGLEAVLPITCPSSVPSGADWLRHGLEQLRRNGRPLPRATCGMLATMLAPGERRPDGLPGYAPGGPDEGAARAHLGALPAGSEIRPVVAFEQRRVPLPLAGADRAATFTAATVERRANRRTGGRAGQRDSAPVRCVLAAVAHDLLGRSAHEVGVALLAHRPSSSVHDETASYAWRAGRGPYAAWRDGRAWLAQLGCWPWAHAESGKLPRRWRADPAFGEPLAAWLVSQTRTARASARAASVRANPPG